jgi:hypothetical protein
MPAFALTAAEIAAAEAAAIAAAEAAAVHAAQVAAAQAAQVAAAEAATQAAAQAATQAATQTATTSGIQTLAQEVAASPPTGIDQLTQAFQNVNPPPMSQAEFLNNSLAGANTPFNPVTNAGTPLSPLTPVSVVAPPAPPPIPQLPTINTAEFGTQYLQNTMPGSVPSAAPPAVPTMTPPAAPTPVEVSGVSPNTGPSLGGAGTGYQGQAVQIGSGSNATPYTAAELQTMQGQSPSGIESLFNQGLDFAKKNPLSVATGANALAMYLNKPEPYKKEKYKSTFKPGLYSGYTPVQPTPYQPQYAVGGLADLGGYSDGGRMLKGPGDGMSDDIPATIAGKQPARLANEEFVIPADVVSHLGNGSSEAGAKQLYKMMDRIRKARTGTKKQGKQINPEKYLA